jgi:hypothetical protein
MNVFISYARNDKPIVDELVTDLTSVGARVWIDTQGIKTGQPWWDEVLNQIRRCDIFIFALSASSLHSAACKAENNYAHRLGKALLPIRVDSCSLATVPADLARLQIADYRSNDKAAFARLLGALQTAPRSKPLPSPLPTPPAVPMSYLQRIAHLVGSPARMSPQQQSLVLQELETGLSTPGERADAIKLLRQFRNRTDVFATYGQEADRMLQQATGSMRPNSLVALGMWSTFSFTWRLALALLVPLFGVINGLMHVRDAAKRGQAAALIAAGVVAFLFYYAAIVSAGTA